MSKYRDVEKLIGDFKKVEDTAGHAKEFFSLLADLLEGAPTVEVATKSEVAREIFEEIEKLTARVYNDFMFEWESIGINAYYVDQFSDELDIAIAELKKKYTEGE